MAGRALQDHGGQGQEALRLTHRFAPKFVYDARAAVLQIPPPLTRGFLIKIHISAHSFPQLCYTGSTPGVGPNPSAVTEPERGGYDKDTRRTIASRVRWSSRLFARSSCHRGAVVEQLLSDAPAAEVAAAPAWPKFRGKRLKCAASHGESPVEVRGRARKLIALRHVAALRVDRAQPRVKPGVQAILLGRESKCCCCGEG